MNKIELLAPAGDFEKLKYAIHYGADAVYFAGKKFGLRAASENFTLEELKEAIDFLHERNKKAYLVLNIIAHNRDIEQLRQYMLEIKDLDFDAYIISDPGILYLAKEVLGEREYHLSTQANNTNYLSASFWKAQGISRVILARELSIEEIEEMVENSEDLEFEAFVHGAMCISYSGRCLMSAFMTGRNANQGDCAQSCRWNYSLVEKSREGEYFDIEEDERGTYFFNSKDLCTLPILDRIVATGLNSLKVEGRNKSFFYVSCIMRIYREALRRIESGVYQYEDLLEEAKKVSHRDYTTGFFVENDPFEMQRYEKSSYIRTYDFIGVVLEYDSEKKLIKVQQRNKFSLGEEIEVIGPDYRSVTLKIDKIFDKDMQPIESAPHATQIVYLPCDEVFYPMDLLRRERKQ